MKLFIMRGVSGCGKSTMARVLRSTYENSFIVSSDALRESMLGDASSQASNKLIFNRIDELLTAAIHCPVSNVIYDATNLKWNCFSKYVTMMTATYGLQSVIIHDWKPISMPELTGRIVKRASEGGLYIPNEVVQRQIETYNNSDKFFREQCNQYSIHVTQER